MEAAGSARPLPAGVQIAPSLLAANFARLAEEVRDVEAAGVEILHLDVMDGHFVPNITFGPPLVAAVRNVTSLYLDTHLMIRDPLAWIDPFLASGADLLTLHAEALGGPGTGFSAALEEAREAARRLGERKRGFGLAFRPATDPMPWIEAIGGLLDLVLLMTVEPGFGGQGFLDAQVSCVARVREFRRARGLRFAIEVDGGIGPATAGACVRAGAEILVAGTAVFGRTDRKAAVGAIRTAALDAAAHPAQ